MEDKGYPKFQWSVFVKNGKDTQYVVRSDSFDEFVTLKNQVLAEVGKDLIASGANVHAEVTSPVQETPEQKAICAICGKPAKLKSGISNKTGKPYAALFCSSEDRSHTAWR